LTSTSGQVYALTGSLAVDNNAATNQAFISANDNGEQAKTAALSIGDVKGEPELAYIFLESGETKLVWKLEAEWNYGNGDFGRDYLFYDASTNQLVDRYPQVHSAKSWKTYTLNGGSSNQAPGQLLCTNTQSCGGNAAAQRAHDGASKVYDYYSQKHGRDSLNNQGMSMISSVDLGEANAYWTGGQMIYGRAGGGFDNDFTADFDVIGHEFTHGVTQYTSGLVYRNESGALNEAWSDIFGVTIESYRNGTTSSSWLLGDGLYNTPGKALRYMNNPTKDGRSKDWYPERYTGTLDNGGVHWNSGIGNLAYVLLVDGGTHPRNKSNAQVPSIGMAKAEKIFYRAATTYMNQNTNFSGARTATANAANDLYGAAEKTAVETAWCAVGVGSCPTGNPPPPPPPGGK
ncbi:M4 family metallopeptidase, partial [Aliikangiella maris]